MASGGYQLTRGWALGTSEADAAKQPRDDIVLESLDDTVSDDVPHGRSESRSESSSESSSDCSSAAVSGFGSCTGTTISYVQRAGPFTSYRRTVVIDATSVEETTSYDLAIPWFGWLFRRPVRAVLARRLSPNGWWTPPDRLDASQVLIVGLLAAASMSAAFVNTLFTQTANFAADDFGVGDTGIGIAGAVVRAGIVLALPAAVLADRIGRRRVIVVVAWIAPLVSLLGAFAPTFGILVATQTVARPMGIALAFLVGVVAAEEMPRNSRAYAVSILAMAAGFGAGIAVMSLGLADLGESGWRLVYLISAVWCIVALDLARRLPETRRFEHAHERGVRINRRRLALLSAVAFAGNIFIASASFFQNRYLNDIRDFSGLKIGIFSLAVGTPASIGLILGGRIADTSGRRRLIAFTIPLSTAAIVGAFAFGGAPLWILSLVGGVLGSAAYPALAVYRAELFPTGNRGRAAGLVTAASLVGGIIGLVSTGALLDAGWNYGEVMALMAIGQVIVVFLVVVAYPETAHRELEELNPQDALFTEAAEAAAATQRMQ